MDEGALVEAGLYDPTAPGADDRLALLRYLAATGASVAEMVEADRDGNLTSLEIDRLLARGDLSLRQAADRAGVPVERALGIYRLLGIEPSSPDVPSLAAEEVRLLEVVRASDDLPEGMGDEILRSIGSGLALVAEAAVSAFVGSVEDELAEISPRARAEATTATGQLGLELGHVIGHLFRHHLRAAVARQRAAMVDVVDRRESEVTVGFVDLVGFTSSTAAMSAGELLAFVQRFQSRTHDVVAEQRGRVVKHIGDEIMYVAPTAADGCAIALALAEAFAGEASQTRGGVAQGRVVARHGDYYGTTVNLAARLVDTAIPGEVLADASLAAAAGDRFVFEPAGRRLLKGFADPVPVVSVAPHP